MAHLESVDACFWKRRTASFDLGITRGDMRPPPPTHAGGDEVRFTSGSFPSDTCSHPALKRGENVQSQKRHQPQRGSSNIQTWTVNIKTQKC